MEPTGPPALLPLLGLPREGSPGSESRKDSLERRAYRLPASAAASAGMGALCLLVRVSAEND